MTVNAKPGASTYQTICFYLCLPIGVYAVIRNAIRIHWYSRAFKEVMGSLDKYRHNFEEIEKIKSSNTKDMVFLQTVFPNFPPNYFRNTQDATKYKTTEGRFYE